MARKRIKKYILNASSSTVRHIKIKNDTVKEEILVNTFNPFNPKIVRV